MERDPFTPSERKRIDARRKRPPKERFEALVKKGIIDANGKVLVRMPDDTSELESAKGPD